MPMLSVPSVTGNRSRAGSLTLPKPPSFTNSGDAFSDWPTKQDPKPFRQQPPSKLNNSFDDSNDNTQSLLRSFDYLGLEDYTESPQRSKSISASELRPNAGYNRLRAHTMTTGPLPPPPSFLQDLSLSPLPQHAPFGGPMNPSPKPGPRQRANTIGIVDHFVVDGVDYGLGIATSPPPMPPMPTVTVRPPMQQQQDTNSFSGMLQNSVSVQSFGGYLDEGNEHDQDFQTPSRSLWVGNLDSSISAPEILSLFSPFGAIESLRMLPDKECVFVNYARVEDALAAREGMTGRKVGGAVVRLGFGRNEAVGDTQGMQPTKSVWIGNIPQTVNPVDLEKMFAAFGPVESCRVLTHKSCGFVNFENLPDAMQAQQSMNGLEVHGMTIKVGFAKVPSKAEGAAGSTVNGFGGLTGSTAKGEEGGHDEMYAASLIPLPDPDPNRRVDQPRLREMRKRLEHPMTDEEEVMFIFDECYEEAVELCTDYIGNVVLQKLVEKSNDHYRALLIEKLGPYLASLSVHKNGTWVVQKVIDSARTPLEAQLIVDSLQPYAPCLLLDQFGNYVIQCCLRLGIQGNQFIFDAMERRCVEISTGRFGARAMRSCLESSYTTKRQQKQVAMAVTRSVAALVTNVNGSLVVAWLVDASSLPGRYRVVAAKVVGDVPALCRHKLGGATILKLVNQRVELDARDMILHEIFFHDYDSQTGPGSGSNLREILSDHIQGVSVVQKILSAGCVSNEERVRFADRVRACLSGMLEVKTNPMAYKRIVEEVAGVPSGLYMDGGGGYGQEVVSPLTPGIGGGAGHFGYAGGESDGYYRQQEFGQGRGYGGGSGVQQQQQMMAGGYGQQMQQQYYGGYSQQQQQFQGYRQ
ncbi:hypothetical protein HDU98_007564 [Podochytrium sp. JEL0797]|nr:hypothetical protein HDU98_007564 [Podochytrium sp. JEL0797]